MSSRFVTPPHKSIQVYSRYSIKTVNRIILVTGSNTGIGFELVKILAQKGHIVYLSARDELKGREAQKKLKNEDGLEVKFVRLDVIDSASIVSAKELIEKEEGRLDVLVNNAGSAFIDEPTFPDAWGESARKVFEVNLFGTVQVTSTFLPLIRKAQPGYGVILNVTSTTACNTHYASGKFFVPGTNLTQANRASAYTSSKAALNSYTITLGWMLKSEGIKVNCASPGLVATNLNKFKHGKPAHEGAEVLIPWILLGPEDEDRTIKFGGPPDWVEESGVMLW